MNEATSEATNHPISHPEPHPPTASPQVNATPGRQARKCGTSQVCLKTLRHGMPNDEPALLPAHHVRAHACELGLPEIVPGAHSEVHDIVVVALAGRERSQVTHDLLERLLRRPPLLD